MGGSPLCGCGVTDSAPGWSILSPAPRCPRETEARALPTGAACRGAGPVVQCRSHAARSWRNAAGVSERLGGKGRSEPVGSRLPTWRAAPNEQQPGTFEPETRLGFPPPPGRRGLWALSFPGERHLTRPQPVPPEKLPQAAHPSGRLGCAKRGVCGCAGRTLVSQTTPHKLFRPCLGASRSRRTQGRADVRAHAYPEAMSTPRLFFGKRDANGAPLLANLFPLFFGRRFSVYTGPKKGNRPRAETRLPGLPKARGLSSEENGRADAFPGRAEFFQDTPRKSSVAET